MSHNYKVNVTSVCNQRDGEIRVEQTIEHYPTGDMNENPESRIFKWLIDTREQQVAEALIALGWTPPAKKETT